MYKSHFINSDLDIILDTELTLLDNEGVDTAPSVDYGHSLFYDRNNVKNTPSLDTTPATLATLVEQTRISKSTLLTPESKDYAEVKQSHEAPWEQSVTISNELPQIYGSTNLKEYCKIAQRK